MLSEHPCSEETDPASANDRDAEGNDMETEQHDQMDTKKQMHLSQTQKTLRKPKHYKQMWTIRLS